MKKDPEENDSKKKEMFIKRAPNPFTFNYQYLVILNRMNGSLLEIEGDLAALYQILGDKWISESELSRLYTKKYDKRFDPDYVKALNAVEGLIYVQFR